MTINKTHLSETTLSQRTLSIYGMTGLPLALVGYPIAIWLPAFYAGEINISLAAVATMLLVAKLTDVVTDPLVGCGVGSLTNANWSPPSCNFNGFTGAGCVDLVFVCAGCRG